MRMILHMTGKTRHVEAHVFDDCRQVFVNDPRLIALDAGIRVVTAIGVLPALTHNIGPEDKTGFQPLLTVFNEEVPVLFAIDGSRSVVIRIGE
jgi:hypothetical protein